MEEKESPLKNERVAPPTDGDVIRGLLVVRVSRAGLGSVVVVVQDEVAGPVGVGRGVGRR